VIVQVAWIAVILLPVLVILGEWFFSTSGGDSSVGVETQRKAGLAIVRIAWIGAILVPVLIILGQLFSGGDGRDSSQQSPEVASARPPAPVVDSEAQKTKTPAPRNDQPQRAREQAQGDSHLTSGAPLPSAAQPGDAGGGAPEITPEPKPPKAPRPKPTPTPPPAPAPTQPPASETPTAPVQTTTVSVANNNDGP
jgi:hypothetical protein